MKPAAGVIAAIVAMLLVQLFRAASESPSAELEGPTSTTSVQGDHGLPMADVILIMRRSLPERPGCDPTGPR